MRCLQVLDVEFNMKNKVLGHRVLQNAKKGKVIQADQYGSRKQHKAINVCLNKVLIMDFFCQKKKKNMQEALALLMPLDAFTESSTLLQF